MRSRKARWFVSAALLLAFAAAVALAGCGGSVGAKAVLENSKKEMADIKTAKMKMAADMSMMGQNMKTTFDVEEEKKGSGSMQLKMTGDVMGQNVEMYIADGVMYMYAEGQWVKSDMKGANLGAGQMGLGSIEEIESALGSAVNPKIVAENDRTYTIEYEVGGAYLDKMLKQYRDQSKGTGIDLKSLGDMKVDATVKVDKKTGRVVESTTKLTMGGGQFGKMSVETKIIVTGYNVPVDVELPPEAKNAKTMPIGQ